MPRFYAWTSRPWSGRSRPPPLPPPYSGSGFAGLDISHDRHEQLMHPRVTGELGMERRRQQRTLSYGDDPTGGLTVVDLRERLNGFAELLDPGRPDEHGMHRFVQPAEADVALERVDLASEGVAPHGHVDAADAHLVGGAVEHPVGQQDHAGAGAERRHAVGDPLLQRLQQVERHQQLADRRRLTAGDDKPVDPVELVRTSYAHGVSPARLENGDVLAHVTLQREHPESWGGHGATSRVRPSGVTPAASRP